MKHGYDTLTEAINDLRNDGYTEDFNLAEDCLTCNGKDFKLSHDGFEIDRLFRFEGATNPSDESILYAISSTDKKIKGILVHAFGPDADPISSALAKKLRYSDR